MGCSLLTLFQSHILNCMYITEKIIYCTHTAIVTAVVNYCLFNVIFFQRRTMCVRVIRPRLGHITLSVGDQ